MIKILLSSFSFAILLTAGTRAEDPTAVASAMNVTSAGATSYVFTVHYRDDGGIDPTSVGAGDVHVTGPGFDVANTYVSRQADPDGRGLVATYSITPPGGSWDSGDNGTYMVVMQASEVFDTIHNSVKPGTIGTFSVVVPAGPPPTPTPPSTSQLLNISTRDQVQSGDNVLIGGFIITGDTPKSVLVRAIGPSLTLLGVNGALADPVLELHGSDGSVITANDNWKATQQTEIEATGAAPADDLESAILITLDPGGYTAIVSGKSNTSGVGLIEVFDLSPAADSQLANISTRGFVGSGDSVMIGGFILGSADGTANILMRALGPSLAGQGIDGALVDPTLELHDENGALVTSNDNWKDAQESEIAATGAAPTVDAESAILVTIPATAHTAIVAGKGGGTGVALVEVYRLP